MKNLSTVTVAFAEASRHRSYWSHLPVDSRESDDANLRAEEAFEALIRTPHSSKEELLMKLGILLEWIDPDASDSAVRLLKNVIRDIENEPGKDPRQPDRPSAYAILGIPRVDRRKRPCVINGKTYASISEASRALGIPYAELRAATYGQRLTH